MTMSVQETVPRASHQLHPCDLMSDRTRLPDERPSVTKKITIPLVKHLELTPDVMTDKLKKIQEIINDPSNDKISSIASILRERTPSAPPTEELEIYVQVGLYPETSLPGEIFLKADRVGSTISGLLDALSMSVSVALQAGVPLDWFVEKWKNLQFEPAGPTTDPRIRRASSIVDAVARWLEYRFLPPRD